MNDMSRVIIPKSDQLNSDDLIAGPITITITEVSINAGTEQPVAISFEGDNGKPWKPCKSMSRVLVAAWGPDAKAYVGRSVTLYRDPKVKWGGMEVGGIRISHLTHIEREMIMALTATKGKRAPYSVKPLVAGATAPKQSTGVDTMLAEIAACNDQTSLRAWWKTSGEAIPDAHYDQVFEAFNARLAAVKNQPAAASTPGDAGPANTEDDAAATSEPAEGKSDEDRGEAPTLDEAKAAVRKARSADEAATIQDSYRGQLSDEDYLALSTDTMNFVAEKWPA